MELLIKPAVLCPHSPKKLPRHLNLARRDETALLDFGDEDENLKIPRAPGNRFSAVGAELSKQELTSWLAINSFERNKNTPRFFHSAPSVRGGVGNCVIGCWLLAQQTVMASANGICHRKMGGFFRSCLLLGV